MKAPRHHVEEPARVAAGAPRATMRDARPAAVAQASMQEIANASVLTRQLRTLQAEADATAAIRGKPQAPARDGVVQRQGGDGDDVTFGPLQIALLVGTLTLFGWIAQWARAAVYRQLAGDGGVQAQVNAVIQEAPEATQEERAAILAPGIADRVEEAAEAAGPAAAAHAARQTAASDADPAAPAHADAEVLPETPAAASASAIPASEVPVPELDVRPAPAPKKASGRPKNQGAKQARERRPERPAVAAAAAAAATASSMSYAAFIAEFGGLEQDLAEMNDRDLAALGLTQEQLAEFMLETKARARADMLGEGKASDREAKADAGRQAAQARMDAELALVYAARTPSGDHYVNWIIDGATYHVTVRGGDTKHVTKEGSPEVHYYFKFGQHGVEGTLPTAAERGSSGDQYLSLNQAPSKVRRFMELYIDTPGAGALFR